MTGAKQIAVVAPLLCSSSRNASGGSPMAVPISAYGGERHLREACNTLAGTRQQSRQADVSGVAGLSCGMSICWHSTTEHVRRAQDAHSGPDTELSEALPDVHLIHSIVRHNKGGFCWGC